jgi:hypothetical protein
MYLRMGNEGCKNYDQYSKCTVNNKSKNASKNKFVDRDQGGWETVKKKKELERWEFFFLSRIFALRSAVVGSELELLHA